MKERESKKDEGEESEPEGTGGGRGELRDCEASPVHYETKTSLEILVFVQLFVTTRRAP